MTRRLPSVLAATGLLLARIASGGAAAPLREERAVTAKDPSAAIPQAGAPDAARLARASELMRAFAERTGLTSERPPQRYLWTDAFAVCNYLGLARASGDPRYGELALRLVDRVHHTLGRYGPNDARRGWLPGASEAHPTAGGLRIGKPLPERRPDEPFDERLEWDRDGQYFHYLTKWMQALDLVARARNEPQWSRQARELAAAAAEAFVYVPPGRRAPRMVWKMSVDLSRPLVPSMGHHDPLDGLVTYAQLRATAQWLQESDVGPGLADAIAAFDAMLEGRDLATPDPLGIGGLLLDASRVAQLLGTSDVLDSQRLEQLLAAAQASLAVYAPAEPRGPAAARLAFRELGLAIGLSAAERVDARAQRDPAFLDAATRDRLHALVRYAPLRRSIEDFWLESDHQRAATWTEHRDINAVMLATALVPDGCTELPVPGS